MLSNPPPSGLHARQRQHRRQNSTPTAFETMKIATNLPNMHHPQPRQQQQQQQQRPRVSHRRGMSLDTRRQQMQSPTTNLRQEFPMVSNDTNNTGFTNTPQHVLREAQQQRIAGPGSQQAAYANLAPDENYLMSPHGTPQMQNFDNHCFDGLPGPQDMQMNFDMYNGPMNVVTKKNQEPYSNSMTASQDFDLYPPSTLSTPTFMSFQDSPTGNPGWISEGETSSTRRGSRRISNGIMDRVSKFEDIGGEAPQRPLTPPKQNATEDYFPLTPMDTPHDRTVKHSQRPRRFAEGYDESMEETVKPTRANRRPKTTFDEMRQAAETETMLPTPQRANTMPMPGAFDPASVSSPDFLTMGHMSQDSLRIETAFEGFSGASHPLSATSSFSQHASPMTPNMGDANGPFDYKPDLQVPDLSSDVISAVGSPSTEKPSRGGSPRHRRNESVASIASAASIASIDIEQTKTTTGITMDDIYQFIQGPDPKDNKWVCTFEDCNKKFGRKENIKSHVQTHLNDRQYKCPTCDKCFVRQHDLKRHAKIHTGVKPYPCECGNSFARHDALTRHKQRGMCIGAFDGVVRKVVKRGRPRKHRPDMDERKDKSTRTRKKNMSISSTSSQSGYSDSSAVTSPVNADEFDMLDDVMDVSMGGTTMNPSSLQGLSSSAPMPMLSADPPMSAYSPSEESVHSYVSQLSHMSLHPEPASDVLSSHPGSPSKSIASPFNEPPELSQSSSPPSCNRFFDAEPISSVAEATISTTAGPSDIPSLADYNNDDILLQFTNDDPNMLMLSSDSKFDEAFGNDNMFNSNNTSNNDDLFF